MVQYANYADPSESAARKKRYKIPEEQGQIIEIAAVMLMSSLQQSEMRIWSISPPDRVPVSQRLGPTNENHLTEPTIFRSQTNTPPKKGPGRPRGQSSPSADLMVLLPLH